MNNDKDKLTPAQLVLVICSGVCLFVAILLGVLAITGVLNAATGQMFYNLSWILLTVGNLLIACANWKKQKVMSTIMIGFLSFFLGAFVIMLFFTFVK